MASDIARGERDGAPPVVRQGTAGGQAASIGVQSRSWAGM